MINYERLITDCFWDLNISSKDIERIMHSEDIRQKAFLFEKILLNSTKLFIDLEMFNKQDLEVFLENYTVPQFNGAYIFRRKNMAEFYFFNKPLLIEDLQWIA